MRNVLLFVLLSCSLSLGQAWNYYIVPAVDTIIVDFKPGQVIIVPKYIHGNVTEYRGTNFVLGDDSLYIVRAFTTTAQRNFLINQNDVIVFPVNIEDNIPSNSITNIRNRLEARNIPGDFVTTSWTWRRLIKYIVINGQLSERFKGLNLGRFLDTYGLNATAGSLPVAVRNKIQQVFDSFGFDYSGFTGATTVRQILQSFYQQWNEDVWLGGKL